MGLVILVHQEHDNAKVDPTLWVSMSSCFSLSLSLYIYRTLFGYKLTSLLQPTTERLILSSTCTFSHMTYLINHVTCLNNTCGWSYELSRSGCSKLATNYQLVQFVTKLCSCIYIYIYIILLFLFLF